MQKYKVAWELHIPVQQSQKGQKRPEHEATRYVLNVRDFKEAWINQLCQKNKYKFLTESWSSYAFSYHIKVDTETEVHENVKSEIKQSQDEAILWKEWVAESIRAAIGGTGLQQEVAKFFKSGNFGCLSIKHYTAKIMQRMKGREYLEEKNYNSVFASLIPPEW